MKRLLGWTCSVLTLCLLCLLPTQFALASVTVYEWTEGGAGNGINSPHVSHHTSGGPVLADDFVPASSGLVTQVEWWGSAPLSTSGPDLWEITFHPNAGGTPDTNIATAILSQHLPVFAGGADPDGDGVYYYSAAWTPQDLSLTAGTPYWFSVANGQLGWTWAFAGGVGPTVGAESFTGVVSSGAPGSPHFGPWAAVAAGAKQDFAFRITAIPEPATVVVWALLGTVGMLFGARRLRR